MYQTGGYQQQGQPGGFGGPPGGFGAPSFGGGAPSFGGGQGHAPNPYHGGAGHKPDAKDDRFGGKGKQDPVLAVTR